MGPQATARPFAVAASIAIHVVVGLALSTAPDKGVGGRRAGADSGSPVILLELEPRALRAQGAPPTKDGERHARPDSADAGGSPAAAEHVPDRSGSGSARAPAEATPADGDEDRAGSASSTSASADAAVNDLPSFRRRLQDHIERYRRYPAEAQRSGAEGIVRIRFVMDRSGRVKDAWVERSSGSGPLDEEALAAVRRAEPLPSLPPGWADTLDVSLPIGFSLQ